MIGGGGGNSFQLKGEEKKAKERVIMPRPRTMGIENNNSIAGFIERISVSSSKQQTITETETLALETLKKSVN